MPRATSKALNDWLRVHVKQVRRPLTLAVGAGAANGLLLILQAWLLALTINAVVIHGHGLAYVWHWLLGLLGVFAGRAVLAALVDTAAFEAAARVKLDLRQRLYTHIEGLGPAWTRQQRSGDLANTAVDGIEALDNYYAAYLPQTVLAVFIPFAILVFVFPTDWVSGIIMLITAPLIPFFMILIGKGAERLNQRQWRKLARMSAHFFDVIEGLTTLKLFNASRYEGEIIAEISDEYRRSTMAVLRVAFLSSLILEFLATVSVAMVAVFIGFRLYYGDMHFLQGFAVLLLAPEFYLPLRTMGTQYHARMEAIGATEQIVKILNVPLPEAHAGSRTLPAGAALDIRYESVGFAYEPQHPVLSGIAFTLRQGERVALVGPSGAGKTTLSQLLLGFIRPQGGRILVNGIDLSELSESAWQAEVAWLPQRPTLFHGTLLDNIRLGRPDADPDAVREAARLANADGFIQRLPQGYDTLIGDRGQGLSGGEIQRIALARAFLKNARLVVLDEASASLDPETESLITESVERLAQDRAMLVIAHRLETVRRADRILVLDSGRIVEQGNHADLLEAGGAYANMNALYRGAAA
ncbi:thiol reductant ABC exporter subunit CydD [Acidihalobacter ferrooxydans]|uniref:Thiol reductant ABC exporter subunit CydD n=2 Tax=Acidihalobacter ferrooxydans TaxID=1765967 RepID=A0A1P8UF69_9GAMM|nr:thiol reductant ABC exporter subunit CydD [Acidihalobacter ferrooxydans]